LKEIDFAEIRLDAMNLTLSEVRTLFMSHPRLIATCRPGRITDEDRKATLITAIESGAAYVDLEVESPVEYQEEIMTKARLHNCMVIISYHNYKGTPDLSTLQKLMESSLDAGADIVKIACMVHSDQDNARLLGLLDQNNMVLVIGMGEHGRITRITAPLLGSPFTFASPSPGKETAEGQMDRKTITRCIRQLAEGIGQMEKLHG
jgi:3-dehydroquinate dehydratase I